MEVLESILALIVTLSILVTIHEYGHYWVARRCGVKVLRFSVGFGKPLYSWYGKPGEVPIPEGAEVQTRTNEPDQGTEFAIAAIPLGGYVKMLDEREGYVPDDQLHMAFNRKPVLQRIAIVAAGPVANFLLAIVAYWLLFTAGVTGIVPLLGDIDPESAAGKAGLQSGQEIVQVDGKETVTWSEVNLTLFERVGDTGHIQFQVKQAGSEVLTELRVPIQSWLTEVDEPNPTSALGLILNYPEIPPLIGGVVEGGAAAEAGLMVDDRILEANGETIDTWLDFVKQIQASPGVPMNVVVQRGTELVDLQIVPRAVDRDGVSQGYIGASRQPITLPPHMQRDVSYPIYSAWLPAMEKTWSVTVFTLDSIGKMIVGTLSTKNLSGPITIAQIANDTASSGLESFISFIALLSISLGVINLLPIPVLDGGHLLYYFIELLAGKPVPEKVQVLGLQMGIFLLVSIMILAFYNDIMRLW